jgi:hypothetical protein
MDLRRLAVLPALAAVLLAAAAAPVSASPSITPETLQCDGTYAAGGNTHTPSPSIRVLVTDTVGMRQGAPTRLGIIPSNTTRALWRFDNVAGTVSITSSCASGCTGGSCWNFDYKYSDPNGSSPLSLGTCVYNSADSCATSSSLSGTSRVPLSLTSCPATPPSTGNISPFSGAQFGQSATFDGSVPHIASAAYDASVWNLNPTYTISAWVKTSAGGVQQLISEEGAPGSWGVAINAGGLEHFDSRDTGTGVTTTVTEGSGLNDGNWHMIDLVRDAGTNKRRFYIDGKNVGYTAAASTDSFNNHPIGTPVLLGARANNSDPFTGDIDELRVSDNAMSDDDIMLEYFGAIHKYAADGVNFSTAAGSFSGTVYVSTYDPTLSTQAVTTTARWIFEAQSTQTTSTQLAPFGVTIDSSKPLPPTLTGTPTSTTDISWTWGAPPRFCATPGSSAVVFTLYDAATGAARPGTVNYPLLTYGDNVGAVNTLASRQIKVNDTWGDSPLSAAATAYTQAATPTGPTITDISTGSLVVAWGANGNPAYTRYEVTYSPDGFASVTSTRESLGDDFTATSVGLTGLTPGTTYTIRVRAYNGRSSDHYGDVAGTVIGTAVVVKPPAPTLSGAALGVSSVTWSWSASSGAATYKLYDASDGSVLFNGAALKATITSLTPNTRYAAVLEAIAPSPSTASAPGAAFIYTLAQPPVSPAASIVYPTSATFTWGANGNPSYTLYEVSVATDPAYSVVVSTLSVGTTSATATGLLPGSTYYARVRALNGLQVYTDFATAASTATAADPNITIDATPPTPYDTATGLVASWQFDEDAGTTTKDSVGGTDQLGFTCSGAGCSSTPTWTASQAGLGSAGSFSGLQGAALSASGTPFAFNDSVSIEAWVKPQTASQITDAGIVARGNDGAEDFALDVSGGVYRFIATPTKKAYVSTATLTAGQWTHLAGVYDSAVGTATLYLDGRPAAVVGGVGARSDSGASVVIGNRRDGSGNLTKAFAGDIDAVRIYHRALSAAEVLAHYQGSFISTITPPSPNAGILVALPANAFGAPAQVYVTADPLHHAIHVSVAAIEAGLGALPAGLTLAPNALIEVVPIVSGSPYGSLLGSSATVSIPYADANDDRLLDGTNPPIPVTSLRLYTLNTTVNRWEELPTTVDLANKRVTGVTPHFSIFALLGSASVGVSLNGVRVYPVPWKPGSGGRFDASGVTFDRLPSAGSIRILTLDGQRVRDLSFAGADAGQVTWDGNNSDGMRTASGVYFARVKSAADNSTVLLKFAIER